MIPFDYFELLVRLMPETILVVGGLIVLFVDQSNAARATPSFRTNLASFLGVLTCGLAIFAIALQRESGSFYHGMLALTSFTRIVKICLLILIAASIASGIPQRFTEHIGEYVALLLLGGVGLLLLGSAEELLTAFIALELTSLSLYLLAGFNKGSGFSAEGALKYFLFGSVAAAFTLFGISLVFGMAGSTSFAQIADRLGGAPLAPLLATGIVLVIIGFAFKLAAAPLHLWAPDAYQGAPAPSAAMIASGSKLASLVVFAKFFVLALGQQAGSAAFAKAVSGWAMALAVIATVSIILGNLLAIAQTNLRRLLAYSAVAHAGYALIAVLAGTERGIASGVFYMFTYGLSIVGIFAVIGLLERSHGQLTLGDLAGLSRRSPLLALSLLVFILSLAGIPPLAGFFGKFYVFVAALQASTGLLWIVAAAIAASAVSLYYYLQVLKQVFVVESGESGRIDLPFAPAATTLVLALAVVFLGCFPQVLLGPLENAVRQPEPVRAQEFTSFATDVSPSLK